MRERKGTFPTKLTSQLVNSLTNRPVSVTENANNFSHTTHKSQPFPRPWWLCVEDVWEFGINITTVVFQVNWIWTVPDIPFFAFSFKIFAAIFSLTSCGKMVMRLLAICFWGRPFAIMLALLLQMLGVGTSFWRQFLGWQLHLSREDICPCKGTLFWGNFNYLLPGEGLAKDWWVIKLAWLVLRINLLSAAFTDSFW